RRILDGVTERLVLIDSNSLIYRAFFAVPPLTTTKGELANATFGFASILLKSIEQTSPQHLAAAFDLPLPTFRHERDATYKATRRPMPDELRPQIERVKELLGKFGIPIYSLPGYEADDVIGALARQAEKAGVETIIVSGDRDPLHLVTPRTKLMTTRQGFQNTVLDDEERIRAEQAATARASSGSSGPSSSAVLSPASRPPTGICRRRPGAGGRRPPTEASCRSGSRRCPRSRRRSRPRSSRTSTRTRWRAS